MRSFAYLSPIITGLETELTQDELAGIEQAVPIGAVAGERYGPLAMKHLDSELPA